MTVAIRNIAGVCFKLKAFSEIGGVQGDFWVLFIICRIQYFQHVSISIFAL